MSWIDISTLLHLIRCVKCSNTYYDHTDLIDIYAKLSSTKLSELILEPRNLRRDYDSVAPQLGQTLPFGRSLPQRHTNRPTPSEGVTGRHRLIPCNEGSNRPTFIDCFSDHPRRKHGGSDMFVIDLLALFVRFRI